MADNVLQTETQIELLFQGLVFEEKRLLPHRLFDDDTDLVIDDRLGEIIEGPDLGCLDRPFDRAVAGDDDDHDMRESPADVAEKIGGLDAGHVDVREEQLDGI